jgi:RNA polymerase sigma-70 factor, ECF subfamily
MSAALVMRRRIEDVYRQESQRVYATLVRLLGDMELAEEALQDAFRAALEQWPQQGLPENPRAWLVSAGRFRAIDRFRRDRRRQALPDPDAVAADVSADPGADEREGLEDDRLRLIFTCCHPELAQESRVALTLREVCGLTTEEVARAWLVPVATMAQRIVRAKARIRAARIPYEVPGRTELPARLDAVLQVIYLVYNEGYSATSGDALQRVDLAEEAIRIARLLVEQLPEPESVGLLALLLLQESRRAARTDSAGNLIVLEEQDRSLWDRERIDEGVALVRRALHSGEAGPYTLQAAIAAAHAVAPTMAATPWADIVHLYDLLLRVAPSPVTELNRAVAVAMRDGPEDGLSLVATLEHDGELDDYHLLHAVKADLFRRMGRFDEARGAYRRALALARQAPERRLLESRLREIG